MPDVNYLLLFLKYTISFYASVPALHVDLTAYNVPPNKLIFHLQNLAQMLSKGIHPSLPLQDLYTFYTFRPWIALNIILKVWVSSSL